MNDEIKINVPCDICVKSVVCKYRVSMLLFNELLNQSLDEILETNKKDKLENVLSSNQEIKCNQYLPFR